jgi:tight adherence protein B
MTKLIVLVFVSVTLLVLAVLTLIRRRLYGHERLVRQRLDGITPLAAANNSGAQQIVRSDQFSHIPLLHRLLQRVNFSKNLQQLLSQADVALSISRLLLMMMGGAAAGLFLTMRSGNPLLIGGLTFALGAAPFFYVLQRRKARRRLFEQQFPDALDMMTSALRAGHGFTKAMQLVAMEAPDPLGMEFRKAFEEQNLGLPIKEALLNLTERLGSVDLKLFVTAVLIQRESGGNLTEVLVKISETIRARFKLMGQVKALTAQGRASSWVLGGLPVALGLIISLLNPDYIMLLFKEPLGRMMITMAVTLQIIGFLAIRKIVNVKLE